MVPETIQKCLGRNLHNRPNHPLELVKNKIYQAFPNFKLYNNFSPVVTVKQNFDDLLIPADHISRSTSDSYYLENHEIWLRIPPTAKVLRTHTSAHQTELLRQGERQFLVTGDVYRRDEIDRFHYPVFHQMEGVGVYQNLNTPIQDCLFDYIEILIQKLFGKIEWRYVESYFPFTNPSWEVEIHWQDKWVEVLGCGIIQPQILEHSGVTGQGWAFGLGLERLAMILCDIPDIRLFWSEDKRFHDQFRDGLAKFVPYSEHPVCYKDVTFWLPAHYNKNDFYEVCRNEAHDLIESIDLLDEFKKDRISHCYRINYRSMDRSLTNEEINQIQSRIRQKIVDMGGELR